MIRKLLLIFVCVIPGAAATGTEDTIGKADCVSQSRGSACEIQWDFTRAPRGFYQVEFLDEGSLSWRALGRPYNAFHTRSESVKPARLYRVRGCDDEAMTSRCVASTVQWAIARPKTDKIPEVLVDGNGVEMHVVKSAPSEVQIAQYNVYRLVQLLGRIPDLSKFPPMTKPQPPNGPVFGRHDDYAILSGIYENYNERRQRALQMD
jgi:hypothetical protein